jgi:CRISPR/Cas system-associated exonuclease Cas4 (RecB family)
MANEDARSKEEFVNELNINKTAFYDILSMLIYDGYLKLKTEKNPSFCNSCAFNNNCQNVVTL